MKIVTVRRICQIFFAVLFIWFCLVTTLGDGWWQLRGWPVNWLIQLDPLVGVGTLLATHRLYGGLIWGIAVLLLTLVLGRVFCGWICPFGALQQLVGYLGSRGLSTARRIQRNRPHPAQRIKYLILIFLLAAAAGDMAAFLMAGVYARPVWGVPGALLLCGGVLLAAFRGRRFLSRAGAVAAVIVFAGVLVIQGRFPIDQWLAASLQTGLLDPIPLMQRSVNLVLLPFIDNPLNVLAPVPRIYQGAGLIGLLFLAVISIGVRIPRFYCRFICPTGALLGLLSRWAWWRFDRRANECRDCRQCESHCEGACAPTEKIATHECVLCFNCIDHCRHGVMGFSGLPPADDSRSAPDWGRREIVTTAVAGLAVVPMLRLSGLGGSNQSHRVIRPPGALDETRFLQRCIKCGQCMRLCPTQVIQPALFQAGVEGLWTPVLDFRMGSSGCQPNCVACSQICPTAAIRPLSLDERMGRGAYRDSGPLRTGTAFVDRGRCLPWAMDTPCIVCQENCPVSPKAIFTRQVFQPLRNSRFHVVAVEGTTIVLPSQSLVAGVLAGGDHYGSWEGSGWVRIVDNTAGRIVFGPKADGVDLPGVGGSITVGIRLQQPYVDPRACIGCGICEHECPVYGLRAIRVSSENESRHLEHRLILS